MGVCSGSEEGPILSKVPDQVVFLSRAHGYGVTRDNGFISSGIWKDND